MKFSDEYKEFLSYAKQNDLFGSHSKIIIALSGGADSMALLSFLHKAYTNGVIASLHAFHLNHSLRAEADSEEEFVRDYCESISVPFTSHKADISSYAKENRISEETAGRKVRYEYLRKLKEELGYDLIATAHHADDNAETIIMRLTRGTALKGMGGIHPKSGDIIRPLLFMTKDEIYSFCEKENIPYVTDMSNFDDKYFRNKVRNNVLPVLREENPSLSVNILRMTEVMREAWDYISSQVDKVPLEKTENSVSCLKSDIIHLDGYLISQVVHKMCAVISGADNVGYEHIKKITRLLKDSDNRWEYDLPGLKIYLADGRLTVTAEREKKEAVNYFHEVKIGEIYEIEGAGMSFSSKIIKKDENFIINSYIKAVDYDKIKGKLFISPRTAEMKFRPVGRNMTKSVSKFLSDLKVPMEKRNTLPVLQDDVGIVAVGNIEIDEKYKITENTQNILLIQIDEI